MDTTTWNTLTAAEKDRVRDNSGLTLQLVGLEGWRVEVEDSYGEKRRFIVGKSTGWRPSHLELPSRASHGGGSADREYKSIKKLYYAH